MKGLILNRNKYIIERSKFLNFIKAASISAAVLLGVGLTSVYCLNLKTTQTQSPIAKQSSPANTATVATADVPQDNESAPAEDNLLVTSNIPATYLVEKIVDGDTIYVSGIKTRIRLIGVNTPETVSSSKPIQCYGPEASNYLKELLLGKRVGLESDSASGDTDQYGRPLRYVYLNGENINQKIILEGYGKEASYGTNYKYRSQFVEAERIASQNSRGLWSPSTCNGQE